MEARPRHLRTTRAAFASVAVAVVLAAAGCGGDDGNGGGTPEQPDSTGDETAFAVNEYIYFLTDTAAGVRLAREPRQLPGVDPAVEAVEAMVAGPQDPDYQSGWSPKTVVNSVTEEGGTIEVDVSEDARTANIGSAGAEAMVQQLVYTVTGVVDEKAGVQLLVDGQPAGELWGAVTWDSPVRRGDPIQVRAPVQIDTPAEDSAATSPLKVTGEAAVSGGEVSWSVSYRGEVEQEGTATTGGPDAFAPFTFEVELEPNTYLVDVQGRDADDQPVSDTRQVTIR
jgi:hypothetical protein